MREALGRIMEGYENQFWQRIPAENRGREPKAEARNSRLRYLARRPWWGGGALRAFRRAEIIFEAFPANKHTIILWLQ